jgi:hypothetical protein
MTASVADVTNIGVKSGGQISRKGAQVINKMITML